MKKQTNGSSKKNKYNKSVTVRGLVGQSLGWSVGPFTDVYFLRLNKNYSIKITNNFKIDIPSFPQHKICH